MSRNLSLAAWVSCLLLTACQHKQETTPTNTADSSSKQSATATGKPKPPASATLTEKSSSAAVDISNAHDINQDSDLRYLTALFIAQTPRQLSDEEKLGLLSADYANETDAFKKKELATKLMPQINNQINHYKGTYLIKMPIVDQNGRKLAYEQAQQQKNLTSISQFGFGSLQDRDNNPSNGYYNFDTHSFTTYCGSSFEAKNAQNIRFDFGQPPRDGTQTQCQKRAVTLKSQMRPLLRKLKVKSANIRSMTQISNARVKFITK